MLVNLSDVLTSEGKTATQTVEIEMTSFKSKMGEFFITKKEPITFILTNIGVDKASIEGKIELTFSAACDRCLTEVPTNLNLQFSREVTSPEYHDDDETDEINYMEGYNLEVDAFVYNEILLNWPMKILCKADCKGICNICGKNLNDGSCGCDTFVPDPRMALIKDIFDANKEV